MRIVSADRGGKHVGEKDRRPTGSRDDKSYTSEGHDSGRGLSGGHTEGRLFVDGSGAARGGDLRGQIECRRERRGRRPSCPHSRGERATQDQENVGEDASQHRGLDQSKLILLQGDDADQEFNGVTKRGVQEGRDALGQAHAQLFRGISQQLEKN
jgi:hypothetical protein